MKKTFAVWICFALSWFAAAAHAQLVIEITKSAEDAVPVAIVPWRRVLRSLEQRA